MDEAIWLFWIIVIIAALGALYYQTHKLYLLMYGLSGVTQVITVFYALTRFEWGRGAIMLILVVAAVVMIAEGYIVSKGRKRSSS